MSKCQDCQFDVPLCTLWRVGAKCLTTPEFLQSLDKYRNRSHVIEYALNELKKKEA